MTEHIISSEWSRLAEDDGTIGLEHFEYDVVIGGESATEITTTPTNISYSPSVNKAKDLTVDVPPATALEDLSYLGEPIQLFVDQQLAFTGEIKEVQTRQKEGEDYTIYGQPHGKKLTGSDVERTANNEIVSDTISKLVDRFNVIDGEHETYAGSADETLVNVEPVGGNVRQATGSPATATYAGVGGNIQDITSLYVKAYVPSDETLTLDVIADTVTTTKTVSGLDKNSYGEWVRFTDFADVVEAFDLEFTLDPNCLLIDWTVVLREDVNRETTAPDINVLEQDTPFYSYSGTELETEVNTLGAGLRYNANNEPTTKQISTWGRGPFPEYTGDDEFEDGVAGRIAYGDQASEWDLDNPDNAIEEWDLYARVKPFEMLINRNTDHTQGNSFYDSAFSGNASASTAQVAVEDSSVEITGDASKSFQWDYDRSQQFGDFTFQGQTYLPTTSPSIDYVIQAGPFVDGHDQQDGYALAISGSEIRLERYDNDSGTTLATDTGYSAQANEWFDWEIVVSGDSITATVTDSTGTYSAGATDTTHDVYGDFAVNTSTTHYIDDLFAEAGPVGGIKNIQIDLNFDGNLQNYGMTIGAPYREWTWERIASHDFFSNFPTSFSSSQFVNVQATGGSETAFVISPMVAVHKQGQWSDGDFDTTLNAPNGYLDEPRMYANGEKFDNTVTYAEVVSEDNIFEATVNTNITNTTDVTADWGVSQVIDGSTTDFPVPSNTVSDSQNFPYPGVQHLTQITLSGSGSRDTASPRIGYNSQSLTSLDVLISTSDLEILFDHNLSNNRLALMNSLAGESTVLFRWEGDTAKIFHRGQETTTVNLNSESISSSVTIEDVYRYCEVIGLHNVRSGLIEAQNAPAYVDDVKVIRDETIENETDAKNRARQFLQEHGEIKFKGSINTMPTFAPLGAEMDGALFNHGQDMVINGVSYGKRTTSISLGHSKDIATELIALETSSQKTRGRATGKGMKIPVGEDQI